MIEFRNFSCYYKRKRELTKVLDGLNLSVPTGELLSIIGESGAGKTTLLRSLLQMVDCYEGQLLIDGIEIEKVELQNANMAYVSQNSALYPSMTVYENIAFPLRNMKTSWDEIDARVEAVASTLGISFLLTRKPRQLSGGQQQRVAIARALVKNPGYILFDEPFSNVEPNLRRGLRELVRSIHAELQPTILFTTHDIGEAFSLTQRIIVLDEGKLTEDGSPEQLRNTHSSHLLRSYFGEEDV